MISSVFKLSLIENKPEAPWIRRTEEGIAFTDNIQIFQDLDLESEERTGIFLSLTWVMGGTIGAIGEPENIKVEAQFNARYSSINSDEDSSTEKNKAKKNILKDLKLDMELEKKIQKVISRDQKKKP